MAKKKPVIKKKAKPKPTKKKKPKPRSTAAQMEERLRVVIMALADRQNPRAALDDVGITNPRTQSSILSEAKKRYAAATDETITNKKQSLIERIRHDAREARPGSRAALRRLEADLEGLIVVKTQGTVDVSLFEKLGINEPKSS